MVARSCDRIYFLGSSPSLLRRSVAGAADFRPPPHNHLAGVRKDRWSYYHGSSDRRIFLSRLGPGPFAKEWPAVFVNPDYLWALFDRSFPKSAGPNVSSRYLDFR